MDPRDIARRRLLAQGLADRRFGTGAEALSWLVAVQSQERAVAPWSLGQRTRNPREQQVQDALASGEIVRTHVLRPTWHYVSRDDVRWLLDLTAPRVHALNRHYYKKLQLDPALLALSGDLLARALEGGRHLPREALARVLGDAGIDAGGLRLGYVLMHAELERIVCSGVPSGRHHTFALFDERVPAAPAALPHDEAVARLTLRYFRSRGPATVEDLSLWSGLGVTDVKRGVQALGGELKSFVRGDRTYWFGESGVPAHVDPSEEAHFLQGYDEYFMSYRGSRDVHDVEGLRAVPRGQTPFLHVLILDGQFAGHWRRKASRGKVTLELQVADRTWTSSRVDLEHAARAYADFLGMPVEVARAESAPARP